MPYFSYGFNGSIGTHTPVAFGSIGFHDITETLPIARLNLLPAGLTPEAIVVFPTAILTLWPLAKTTTFCIPTPAKVVAENDVDPKNIFELR